MSTSSAAGWIVLAVFLLAIVGALLRHQYGAAAGFLVFEIIGFLAIATAGSIKVGDTGLEHRNLFGRFRIAWSDVRRIEVGNAGTIVLHGQDRRFALMPPGYWSGRQKPEAIALLQKKLKPFEANISRTNTGDYKIHKNVRVRERIVPRGVVYES